MKVEDVAIDEAKNAALRNELGFPQIFTFAGMIPPLWRNLSSGKYTSSRCASNLTGAILRSGIDHQNFIHQADLIHQLAADGRNDVPYCRFLIESRDDNTDRLAHGLFASEQGREIGKLLMMVMLQDP